MSFSFVRPGALGLLALLPFLALVFWNGSRRRRTMVLRFGSPASVAALSSLRPKRRTWSRLLLLAATLGLAIALAGPRWGKGDPGVMVGRDLMIVLDLSKSMLADDMRDPSGVNKERWQAARASIHDLIESMRARGGHRVGLVVFAAKPWILTPLTSDYDHFLTRLDEYSPQAPPPEVNPVAGEQFPSGTRIGAAIEEAARWHDERFPGYQDVLLLSDGDDPADDREAEIERGIRAARAPHIPVHVVGLGDPDNPSTFAYKRGDGEEEIVGPTRLVESPLKEIARQTGGQYLPARRIQPDLVDFFRTQIESRPMRELSDEALPQQRDRSPWFLLPALVLLFAAWIVES